MRCDLQIFSGCVCPLEQLHAQSPFLFPIVFSINNNYASPQLIHFLQFTKEHGKEGKSDDDLTHETKIIGCSVVLKRVLLVDALHTGIGHQYQEDEVGYC